VGLVVHPGNALSKEVIGAAIEVHRHLGPGLLESSYLACLSRELEVRGVNYESQVVLSLEYKGMQWPRAFVVDLFVERLLVVEVKSVEALKPIHTSQLLTYMRLLSAPVGLVMNFNVEILVRGIRRRLL